VADAFALGFVSAVFDNIPLTELAIKQGGYDWGFLAFAVGYGGSMIWFGSSAGVALSNIYPESRSSACGCATAGTSRSATWPGSSSCWRCSASTRAARRAQQRGGARRRRSIEMNDSGRRARVFVTRRMYPFLIDELRAIYELDLNQEDRGLTPEEFAQRLALADGALTFASERVDETVLAHADRLKVVANVAVGYNNFDLAAFTRHGVLATNTPNVLNESVADHALALLLAAARRVCESERWLRAGHGSAGVRPVSRRRPAFAHARIIGLGRIGHAIARRRPGSRCGCSTTTWRGCRPSRRAVRSGRPARPAARGRPRDRHGAVPAEHASPDRAAELALMKPRGVRQPGARGVVDDAALVRALARRQARRGGLDVFENEPKLNPACSNWRTS